MMYLKILNGLKPCFFIPVAWQNVQLREKKNNNPHMLDYGYILTRFIMIVCSSDIQATSLYNFTPFINKK